MAAPEYFVKLKFGSELDKKTFADIQQSYANLTAKQKEAFSKTHRSTVKEMDALLTRSTKSYEQAMIKTEQTITSARVKELRNYVQKRNELYKALPAYTGTALLAGGVQIGGAMIANSTKLTSYEKSTYGGAFSGLTSGTIAGGAAGSVLPGVGTVIGAAVGATVGVATGMIMGEIENEMAAFNKAAQLFASAVQTYQGIIDEAKMTKIGATASGFESEAQFAVFHQALRGLGIEDVNWMYDMQRTFQASNDPKLRNIGNTIAASRADAGLLMLENKWKASGQSAREFVTSKTGLNQSDSRAAALITLFESGGLQNAINDIMKVTNLNTGQNASTYDPYLAANAERSRQLSNRRFAASLGKQQMVSTIDMNDSILKSESEAFNRNLKLMNDTEVLLSGMNQLYKSYEEELRQTFEYIFGATGTRSARRKATDAIVENFGKTGDATQFLNDLTGLNGGGMSSMTTKVDYGQSKMSKKADANRNLTPGFK